MKLMDAESIEARARIAGVQLGAAGTEAMLEHGRAVLGAESHLHLSSIREPEEFLERHVGESLDGAAMVDAGASGVLVDLGSGNGYPGLAVAAARPGLRPVLAESSSRKAGFLRNLMLGLFPDGEVLEASVQRAADVEQLGPLRLVVTRAMGGWEKIVPRLARALSDDGEVLIWAGAGVDTLARRRSWSGLELVEQRLVRGRDRSWIWRLSRR